MKILLVNKFWYPHGGAETHVLALKSLLEERGHLVVCFGMRDKKNIATGYEQYFVDHMDMRAREGIARTVRKAAHIIYSTEAAHKLDALIRKERPDIAHLHNIYHHLSPSILSVLRREQIPTVMTLHDWKLVCPNYSMVERGRVCEQCCGASYLKTVSHRAMWGSLLPSIVVTVEAAYERMLGLYGYVHTFICPSEFQRKKMIQLYYPRRGNFITVHNFISCAASRAAPERKYLLFVGRLAPEKGLRVLLEAAAGIPEAPLHIVGDGPEGAALKSEANARGLRHISFLGSLAVPAVRRELQGARALIIPTTSYEVYPTVALEALCAKTPVIASDAGGTPEIVHHQKTGLTVPAGDARALLDAMKQLWYDAAYADKLGVAGAAQVRKENNPDRFYAALMDIYRRVCTSHPH